MALNLYEKGFVVPKQYQIVKSENYETFCVFKFLIWRQKWVAFVRHGNLQVVRRVSPGKMIVVLFWTKYVVPRPIKPRILAILVLFRLDS